MARAEALGHEDDAPLVRAQPMERVNGWSGSTGGARARTGLRARSGSARAKTKTRNMRSRSTATATMQYGASGPAQAKHHVPTDAGARGSRSPRAVVACGQNSADKIDFARKKVSVDTLLCFMMHRVQKSRAESLMANSSIFVLKNNLEKNAKQNRNGHCLIYTSVETD